MAHEQGAHNLCRTELRQIKLIAGHNKVGWLSRSKSRQQWLIVIGRYELHLVSPTLSAQDFHFAK